MSTIFNLVALQKLRERKSVSKFRIYSEPFFEQSRGWNKETLEGEIDTSTRSSVSTVLPSGHLSKCISRRATSLMGWDPLSPIQALYAQRYTVGGQYVHHYDWFPDDVAKSSLDGNRDATFLIYLEANDCEGGGTNFPRLDMPQESEWCQFVECSGNGTEGNGAEKKRGVTFKPIVGNGIFWLNLRNNGSGHPDTLHAGLPVTKGIKTGLNIWTWRKRAGNNS